jgi:hypothetical protein
MMQKYAGFSPLMKILYRLLPGRHLEWVVKGKESAENSHFLVASNPEVTVTAALQVKNTSKYRRFLGFYIDPVITRQLTGMPLAAEQL